MSTDHPSSWRKDLVLGIIFLGFPTASIFGWIWLEYGATPLDWGFLRMSAERMRTSPYIPPERIMLGFAWVTASIPIAALFGLLVQEIVRRKGGSPSEGVWPGLVVVLVSLPLMLGFFHAKNVIDADREARTQVFNALCEEIMRSGNAELVAKLDAAISEMYRIHAYVPDIPLRYRPPRGA